MKTLGLNVLFVSRSGKGNILSYSDLTSDIIKSTDIIINTTPLGMYPNTASKPDINYNLLNENTSFSISYIILSSHLSYQPERRGGA